MTLALVSVLLATATPFQWELPPQVITDVPIDGTITVGTVEVRMRRVVVKGEPGVVGKHFVDSFVRQGLWVKPGQHYDRVLTGVRPDDLHTFTVLLDVPAKGLVGLMLGESDVGSAKRAQPVAPVPLMPEATDVLVTTMEGGSQTSYSAVATAEQVTSFYRATPDLLVTTRPDRRRPGALRINVILSGAAGGVEGSVVR